MTVGYRPAGAGRAVREHDPHPFHGRRPAGELRPPGDADGAGADRLPALHAGDEARPRSTRTGPAATASSSRAVTRRCSSTRTLYLSGYDITLDQIKKFRQLDSPAAGHPEYGHVPGVETTTGPLGQGISTAVGMALGERMLAARFNKGDHTPVDNHTYFIASDGDLEEGIASRGLLDRRPPRPRQADRLLRRQPHLDRGRHEARLLRGRRQALRGLRLARPEPARGHRARRARAPRSTAAQEVTDRPSLIIVRTHIAPGLAEQAGHARRARLAARRGGDPAHQGGLRLPEPRAVLRPRRRARALPRAPSSAAASSRSEWEEAFAAYRERVRRRGRPSSSATSSRALPAGFGDRRPEEGPGRRHDRHPQGLPGGHPVGGGRGARADRRLGRPRALHADADRRRRERRGRRVRRAQPPLRHPRARDGRDRQRPDAVRASAPTAPAS